MLWTLDSIADGLFVVIVKRVVVFGINICIIKIKCMQTVTQYLLDLFQYWVQLWVPQISFSWFQSHIAVLFLKYSFPLAAMIHSNLLGWWIAREPNRIKDLLTLVRYWSSVYLTSFKTAHHQIHHCYDIQIKIIVIFILYWPWPVAVNINSGLLNSFSLLWD